MRIQQATAEQIIERKEFKDGSQRLTYNLPLGGRFLSCINGQQLLYVAYGLDSDLKEPCNIWVIPGEAELPPEPIKYLGSYPGGTTPVHYFCEECDFAEGYR